MSGAENRNLIVVTGIVLEVRKREETQQHLCLRAQASLRNFVAGERRAGERIENWTQENPVARGLVRHKTGSRGGVVVSSPLVIEEEVDPLLHQARNLDRPTQRQHAGHPVISREWRVLAGEGKWPGI